MAEDFLNNRIGEEDILDFVEAIAQALRHTISYQDVEAFQNRFGEQIDELHSKAAGGMRPGLIVLQGLLKVELKHS